MLLFEGLQGNQGRAPPEKEKEMKSRKFWKNEIVEKKKIENERKKKKEIWKRNLREKKKKETFEK